MSNLGFHSLFDRSSSFPGVRVARFFLERNQRLFSPEALDPRRKDIFSSGYQTLKAFDALFFTVSFELDYINVVRMLILSDIAPLAKDRRMNPPFIVTGGVAVTANPFIMAAFSDLVFLGDMEENIEKMLRTLLNHRFIKDDFLLERMSEIDGAHIPEMSRKPPKRSVAAVITRPAHSVVLTGHTEFSNMFLIEIVRGCRNSCMFCMTRCITGPVRAVEKDVIIETVKKALPFVNRTGLIGPVLTDHRCLSEIVAAINGLGFRVSFSSLRADDFNDTIAGLLRENGQKSLTLAPETGSYELRKRVGKNLTEEALLNAVSIALHNGIKEFRYYIMYGLPGEVQEDIIATSELIKRTIALFPKRGCGLRVSVNPFIPKKSTPLEDMNINPTHYYKNAQGTLEKELAGIRNLKMRFESTRMLYVHTLLSVGSNEDAVFLSRSLQLGSLKSFSKYAEGKLVHG
jgi:radical SAM superfamily enzyme YgiQ (UPF0313 family)